MAVSKEHKKLTVWLEETRQLEKEDDEGAVTAYKQIIRIYPLSEAAHNRLMITYRKLKMKKEEMAAIDQAIEIFRKSYGKNTKITGKIASLSKSILLSTGLQDKKGNAAYHPEPIARWLKRKELLQKKP